MYQFQEGFPSPMIELRSRPRARKPQTLTVSLQSAPVASGAGRVQGTADASAQASRKHTWPLAPGLGSAKQARLAYECTPFAIDTVRPGGDRRLTNLPQTAFRLRQIGFPRGLDDDDEKRVVSKNGSWESRGQGEACRVP